METELHVVGGGDAEGLADVAGDLGRGGGGEAEDARDFQAAADFRELEVVRAEIVAPLGDAMRFVDGGELDGQALEPLTEGFVGEALGGDVEQLEGAGVEARVNFGKLTGIERGVEAGGGNALGGEGVHLVAHQRDERGNDEGEAVEQERGKLIAERFPAAGGENGEGGAAVQQGADDGFLALAEGIMAETGAEGGKHGKRIGAAGGKRQAGSGFSGLSLRGGCSREESASRAAVPPHERIHQHS